MNKAITSKKIFLKTMGCQMNEYDSELVRSILTDAGYVFVEDELEADVIMLNTCSVRESAHRKVFGHIHEIRHKRKGARQPLVGILGCMATSLREKLINDSHLKLDFVVGPDSYKRLPELIQKCLREEARRGMDKAEKQHDFSLSEFETYANVYPRREAGINAWVAVMRGCNNFCSFCIVPYTRGRERSRSMISIKEEVERLVDEGFAQVTLLGQNVNSYSHDGIHFARLLEEICRVKGLERIRFTSPHPKDFPDELIELVARNPKVCKHIHLPLQAGNSRVLALMNRGYTKEDYLSLACKIRGAHPDMSITTDIIVGFPTETEVEFEDTIDVMCLVEFDAAFIFKYSQREGTMAARKFFDDVSEQEKTRRIVILNDLQKQLSFKRNQLCVGKEMVVLIEDYQAKNDEARGRSDNNKIVNFFAKGRRPWGLQTVLITHVTPHTLKADIQD